MTQLTTEQHAELIASIEDVKAKLDAGTHVITEAEGLTAV